MHLFILIINEFVYFTETLFETGGSQQNTSSRSFAAFVVRVRKSCQHTADGTRERSGVHLINIYHRLQQQR
jgi:hypothetical protein